MISKEQICYIRAKLKNDYVFDAIKNAGFYTFIPYKDYCLFFRLLREVWIRLDLPFKAIWYNKKYQKINPDVIILGDPLITPHYIEWLHKQTPDAKLILIYENRAEQTINPQNVPRYVNRWSYDLDDCKKYGMNKTHSNYFDIYSIESNNNDIKYDILYLGRDKGRMEQLLRYKECFEEIGLSTYFHICADRSFLRMKNRHYKRVLPYTDYLELLKKSRAILNIVPQGQKSITQRELEAVFDNKKCITNNEGILDFDLYDKSRYFILGQDDIDDLRTFLYTEFKPVDKDVLDNYTFESVIELIVTGSL